MIDIVSWAESKYGFYVDRLYQDGRWVLEKAPIKLADYHARILRHIFTPDEAGHWHYDVAIWCEPAKSGKSALAGLVAEYVALHGEQNSSVICASNKQDQAASLMFKSLTDSIEFNPHLRIEPNKYDVSFRNGCTVRAIPSNSRGEAGARFALALFDELWAYVYQDAERLWSEFKTDPTRTNSMRFAVGYAGYVGESELWEGLLNSGLRGEPVPELADITNDDGSPCCFRNGRQFTFWSHVTRQPWQTEAWLESQRKALRPAEFLRMIKTEFAEGIGNFCDPDAWAACISPDHAPLPPGSYQAIIVGVDAATAAGGDDCALAGVYFDEADRKTKLAFHKIWRGGKERREQLKLKDTLFPYLLHLKEQYNIVKVCFDPYQMLSVADDLRNKGFWCKAIQQTLAGRAPYDTGLLEMVNAHSLVLYPHPDIATLSNAAAAKELDDGRIFIRKVGKAKIDLLIALSNCAIEAKKSLFHWAR